METEYSLHSFLAAWLLSSWLILTGLAAHTMMVVTFSWVVRCLGVLLLLAPTLIAEAYELFWLLGFSVAFSVALIAGLRKAGCGQDASKSRQSATVKYSIGSVFFFTALSAGAIVIVMRTPALNPRAWLSLLLIAITTSFSSAVAYYACYANRSKAFRLTLAGLASVLIAIPLSLFDWLLLSLYIDMGWPPDMAYFTWGMPGVAPPSLHPEWMWFGVSALVTTCLILWSTAWSMHSNVRRLSITGGVLAIVVPPLILSLALLHVPELPKNASVENAYPQVAALSAKIGKSNFEKAAARYGDWETIPPARLSSLVRAVGSDLNDLVELLDRPIRPPVDFSIDNMPMDDILNFRTVAKALVARGRLRSGERSAALDGLGAVRLGIRTRRGGLLVEHLAGLASSSLGLRELYAQRVSFDNATRIIIARQLLALREEIEPIQSILETERKWMVRQGWHNHLTVLLSELSGESTVSVDVGFLERLALQEQTVISLLATELALQSYLSQNGISPDSLQQLVPDWLPNLPEDSHANDNRPLNYQLGDGYYILYSVGVNGLDENGTVTEQQPGVMPMDGDLRLDGLFGNSL